MEVADWPQTDKQKCFASELLLNDMHCTKIKTICQVYFCKYSVKIYYALALKKVIDICKKCNIMVCIKKNTKEK